ncbi:hypothetical protein ACOT81_25030 [Streptomyces sp. WI04-05B]|uniref:hypothetical protein n=1 Tax=Streptomyces TaxID=1883 RepID=UPI0029B64D50|nr:MULTISPECIES: hypothetical protein [unclassified Streptomyces]MDX2548749.1 hypothetical protein [Streptomyces sp. WI04-05B]MDX2590426.1 hypothetical protein [Streptomyces sp. WI04-05A]MDX3747528.1 hypothetical protein [Streptomyces sp. AK08-02]
MEHVNANGVTVPRLLPWPSPEGKPCYLVADDHGSRLSRLADDLEAVQLASGADVLELARDVLDDPASPYTEVRYAGIRLAECLTDALRVDESRGMRLPAQDAEGAEPGDGQAANPEEVGLAECGVGRGQRGQAAVGSSGDSSAGSMNESV